MTEWEALITLAFLTWMGGVLSGLLSIGGGVLLVTSLFYLLPFLGVPAAEVVHISMATSMATVTGTMGMNVLVRLYHKVHIDSSLAKIMWLPMLLASLLSTVLLAPWIKGPWLQSLFIGVTLYLAFQSFRPKPSLDGSGHIKPWWLRLLAMGVGTVAPLSGLGGGALFVPILSALSVPLRSVIASVPFITLPASAMALAGYAFSPFQPEHLGPWVLGYVHLKAALVMLPMGILGSPVGIWLGTKIATTYLRYCFGLILIAIAVLSALKLASII